MKSSVIWSALLSKVEPFNVKLKLVCSKMNIENRTSKNNIWYFNFLTLYLLHCHFFGLQNKIIISFSSWLGINNIIIGHWEKGMTINYQKFKLSYSYLLEWTNIYNKLIKQIIKLLKSNTYEKLLNFVFTSLSFCTLNK